MMTVDELSKYLKVSAYTIRKMARDRKIPYYKLGYNQLRFDRDEINKYLNAHLVKPKK